VPAPELAWKSMNWRSEPGSRSFSGTVVSSSTMNDPVWPLVCRMSGRLPTRFRS